MSKVYFIEYETKGLVILPRKIVSMFPKTYSSTDIVLKTYKKIFEQHVQLVNVPIPGLMNNKDFLLTLDLTSADKRACIIAERFINQNLIIIEESIKTKTLNSTLLKDIVFDYLKNDPLKQIWIDKVKYTKGESLLIEISNIFGYLLKNQGLLEHDKNLYLHLVTQINIFNIAESDNVNVENIIYDYKKYNAFFEYFSNYCYTLN